MQTGHIMSDRSEGKITDKINFTQKSSVFICGSRDKKELGLSMVSRASGTCPKGSTYKTRQYSRQTRMRKICHREGSYTRSSYGLS